MPTLIIIDVIFWFERFMLGLWSNSLNVYLQFGQISLSNEKASFIVEYYKKEKGTRVVAVISRASIPWGNEA